MVRDLSRRRFLWLAAGLPVVAACSDGDSSSAPSATAADTTAASRASTSTTASLPEGATSTTAADGTAPDATDGNTPADVVPEVSAADFAALGACRLYPRSTAGPYPLDEQFDRRDITEGYPGHPVLLGLRVVDTTCEPVPGAAVEIWHTDHTGDYSAFRDGGDGKNEAAGTTFMRGTQVADEDGIVRFDTIYPGWYPGRAVHIHLRVRVDAQQVLTGQLYFDESYTERVFAEEPYAEFGLPDTTHSTDGISGDPAVEGTMLTARPSLTGRGVGTLALANLGVET